MNTTGTRADSPQNAVPAAVEINRSEVANRLLIAAPFYFVAMFVAGMAGGVAQLVGGEYFYGPLLLTSPLALFAALLTGVFRDTKTPRLIALRAHAPIATLGSATSALFVPDVVGVPFAIAIIVATVITGVTLMLLVPKRQPESDQSPSPSDAR